MGWLGLSLKNPHKIIDIEYQNPCNVCAALSFEGFQETREPSEDTPQSFRASSFGFIWGSWTQSIQLSECNSKLKCCAFTKNNTIILMDVPLWYFFGYSAPKKKNNRSVNFPMQRFNHEGHGDHFCTGFQPTDITQEMQGLILPSQTNAPTLLLAKHGKTHPWDNNNLCCIVWFFFKKTDNLSCPLNIQEVFQKRNLQMRHAIFVVSSTDSLRASWFNHILMDHHIIEADFRAFALHLHPRRIVTK